MAALTYRQVKDIYDNLADAGVVTQSLPDWSAEMGEPFAAGLQDNWIKRTSVGIDRLLEATGIPDLLGDLGEGVGDLVGNPEAGRNIGRASLRSLVNFAPVFAGGPLGLLGTGALAGSDAYTQTGSPGAGVFSGLLSAAMPGIGAAAEKATLKALGGEVLEGRILSGAGQAALKSGKEIGADGLTAISQVLPKTIAQGIGGQVGANLGAGLASELAVAGKAAFDPEEEYHFSPTEALLNMTLGQVPFAGLYATRGGRAALGGKTSQEAIAQTKASFEVAERAIARRDAVEAAKQKVPLEEIPKTGAVIDPTAQAQFNNHLEQLRNAQRDALKEATPESMAEAKRLQEEEDRMLGQTDIVDLSGVAGVRLTDNTPRTTLVGRVKHINAKGTWKLIETPDGKLFGYSTKNEPEPIPSQQFPGFFEFSAPNGWTSTYVDKFPKKPKVVADPNQLELQPGQEVDPSEYFDHVAALAEVDAVMQRKDLTPVEFQDQIIKLNGILESRDLTPITDGRIEKRREILKSTWDFAARMEMKAQARLVKAVEAEKAKQQDNITKAVAAQQGVSDAVTSGVQKGVGGAAHPVVKLPKNNAILHDVLRELVTGQVNTSKVKADYDAWQASGTKDKSPLAVEMERYVLFSSLRAMEDIGDGKLTRTDYEVFLEAMREEGIAPDDILTLGDYLERPHVKTWEAAVQAKLGEVQGKANAPGLLRDIPAGEGFIWSMEPYDQEGNRIGKHKGLPKSGIVPVSQFQIIAGKGKPLNKVELELAKLVAPEAFSGDTVNLKALYAKLDAAKEVVTKVSYGMEGKVSEAKAKLDQMTHEWFDTLPNNKKYQYNEAFGQYGVDDELKVGNVSAELREYGWSEAEIDKAFQYDTLQIAAEKEWKDGSSGPRATSYYRQISPFDTEKYPVLRIDVALPGGKPEFEVTNAFGKVIETTTDRNKANQLAMANGGNVRDNTPTLWQQDDLHENLPNTLGWAMVQFPEINGEKVMFVGEQQSRWGQEKGKVDRANAKVAEKRETIEREIRAEGYEIKDYAGVPMLYKDGRIVPDASPTLRAKLEEYMKLPIRDGQPDVTGHPLLPIQHILVLKAAIAEARKRGVSKIVISDGESAMMTEGHDKAAQPADGWRSVKEGDWIAVPKDGSLSWKVRSDTKEGLLAKMKDYGDDLNNFDLRAVTAEDVKKVVSQEGGMRLHYDQTLQSAMRTLTGDKGEKVELGTHKNAKGDEMIEARFKTEEQAKQWAEQRNKEESDNFKVEIDDDYSRVGDKKENFVVRRYQGSPVFKQDGKGKLGVTGTSYDISKFSPDSQFTLGDPARTPYLPKTQGEALVAEKLYLNEGAAGGLRHILEEPSFAGTWYAALAKDLKNGFPETLKRMKAQLVDSEEPSSAFVDSNRRMGGITYRSHILAATPEARATAILHEVVHQVTMAELRNPTKSGIVSEISQLRERLRAQLPSEMRNALKKAEDARFLERYGRGEAEFTELHTDLAKANVLYGLLNNDEFVSQGLTSPEMRKLLMATQGKPGGGYWNKFVGFVRKLVGLRPEILPGSALAEFLGYTDALATQGEYVATFQNFAERHLESRGYNTNEAIEHTRRALAIVTHSAIDKWTPGILHDFLARNTGPESPELVKAKRDFVGMINERGERFQEFTQTMAELGVEPSKPGLDSLVQEALAGEVPLDALEVLPDEATAYVFQKLHNMRDVLDVIKAATDKGNKGLINISNPENLHGPISEALGQIDNVLTVEKLVAQSVAIVESLKGVEPGAFFLKGLQAPDQFGSFAPAFFRDGLDDTKTSVKSFFKKFGEFFRPPAQYEDPALLEAWSFGRQLQANINLWTKEAKKPFSIDLKESAKQGKTVYTHENTRKVTKWLSTPKLRNAIDGWIHVNQENGKETGKTTLVKASDPRVEEKLKGLNAEERAIVAEEVAKRGMSQRESNAFQLKARDQYSELLGTQFLNRVNGGKHKDNMVLSRTVLDALKLDWNDPQQAAIGQQQLMAVQARIQPEHMDNFLRLHRANAEMLKDTEAFFADHPEWSSAQISQKYIVKFYNKQGKLETQGAINRKDAEQIAGGRNKIVEFSERRKAGDDDVPHLGSDYQAIFERLAEKEKIQRSIFETIGADPEFLETLDRTSPSKMFAAETQGQGLTVPTAPARTLGRGAENRPYLSNHLSNLERVSRYWGRKLFRMQIDAYTAQADIPDDIKKLIKTHRDNILMEDPEAIKMINSFTRVWFMGANAANVIVNAVQPFTTHVAELTNLTGKPIESYRRTLSALKEIGGWKWGKKEWSDPETNRLMQKALDDGEIGLSAYDDEATIQEASELNYKEVLDGDRPKTLGQRLEKAGGMYSKAAMWLFSQGEQINNRAALLASFRLFREKGLSFDDAYAKARLFNARVNFGGGKASRPIGAFSSRSPVLRGTAMLGTAMQSYVLGTTFQIIRYLKNGLFRPANLTPAERHAALKAGVQMLGTQLAAAGLLGLPFVSGALSLLEKAFPEWEPNKKVRETMESLTGDSVLNDMAMTGIPSMLGWDLQSRLTMGNTLPGVSEVNGFQPENLLGPPANLVSQFLKGGTKLLQGDAAGARNFLPSAFKKASDLIGGEGKLKDYRDREILDPTPGEKLGAVLGFNPKRLSDFNAASRMSELNETVERRREGEFRHQLAEEVLKGNFGTVQAMLKTKKSQSPEYDLEQAVRGIARTAEELTFPRDLRREGSSPNRSKLLQLWNLPQGRQVTEVERLQFRKQIEAKFGLATASQASVKEAMIMDQLRQQNPMASRTELRRLAERALRHEASRVRLE